MRAPTAAHWTNRRRERETHASVGIRGRESKENSQRESETLCRKSNWENSGPRPQRRPRGDPQPRPHAQGDRSVEKPETGGGPTRARHTQERRELRAGAGGPVPRPRGRAPAEGPEYSGAADEHVDA